MSDQFLRWYRDRSTHDDFAVQVDFFGRRGVYVEHPSFQCGVLLDVDGGDVRVDVSEIGRLIDLKIAPLNVEFWLTSDINITCHLNWVPLGFEVQTFYLDGLTEAQSRSVESTLIDYIRQQAPSTFGYVLDRSGSTAEYDWDGFYDGLSLGRPKRLESLPDVFAVKDSIEHARQILDIPDSAEVDQYDGTLVEVRKSSV